MDIHFLINGQPLHFGEESSGGGVAIANEEFTGTIRKVELADGLCLYLWDLVVEKAGSFTKEFFNNDDDTVYTVHYHAYPDYERLEYVTAGTLHSSYGFESTLLLLNCPGRTHSIYVQPSILRRVMLAFNRQWLLKQLTDLKSNEPPSPYILGLISSDIERVMSKGEVALVQMLFDIFKGHAYSLEVKSHVYQLISFLYRRAAVSMHRDVASAYQPLMARVERRILSSLSGSMPSLEELARESLISVSTLKRQFKETFEVSIYDYYLHRKMEFARELLQKGGLSVSAVAFQLGYESVSHFTSIFKKILGYPPGQIRRSMKQSNTDSEA